MTMPPGRLVDAAAQPSLARASVPLLLFAAEEIELDESRGTALGALLGAAARPGDPDLRYEGFAAASRFVREELAAWRDDAPEPAPLGTRAATEPTPGPAVPAGPWEEGDLVELGPLTMVSTGEVLPEVRPAAPSLAGALGGIELELELDEPCRVASTPVLDELTVAEIEQLVLPARREAACGPALDTWGWVLELLQDEAARAPMAQLAADLQLAAAHAAAQLGATDTVVELLREACVHQPREVGALVGLWREQLRRHDLRAAAALLADLAPTIRIRERNELSLLRADLLFAAGAPLDEVRHALPDEGDSAERSLVALDLAAAEADPPGMVAALASLLRQALPASDARSTLALVLGRVCEASGDLAAAQRAYDEAASREVTRAAATLGSLRLALRNGTVEPNGALMERASAILGPTRTSALGGVAALPRRLATAVGASDGLAEPPSSAAAGRADPAAAAADVALARAIEQAWASGAGAQVCELTLQLAGRMAAPAERAQLVADAGWAAETLENDAATAAVLYAEALQRDPQHGGAQRGLQRLATQHPDPPAAVTALDGLAATPAAPPSGPAASAWRLHAARVLATAPGHALAMTQRLAAALISDPGAPVAASWLAVHGQQCGQVPYVTTALETAAAAANDPADAARLWQAAAELYEAVPDRAGDALRCYRRAAAAAGETARTAAAVARLTSTPGLGPLAQGAAATGAERVAAWQAAAAARWTDAAWLHGPGALDAAARGDWGAMASELRRAGEDLDARSWTTLARSLRLAALLEHKLDAPAAAAQLYARLAAAPIVAAAAAAGWWRCSGLTQDAAPLPPSLLQPLLAELGQRAAPALLLLAFDARLTASTEARDELALHLVARGPWSEPWRLRAAAALRHAGHRDDPDERVTTAVAAAHEERGSADDAGVADLRALGEEAQLVAGADAAAYWLVFGGRRAVAQRMDPGDRARARLGNGTPAGGGLAALPTAQSAFGRVVAGSGSWGVRNALLQLLAAAWSARDRQRVASLSRQWARLGGDAREAAGGELLAELVLAGTDPTGGTTVPLPSIYFLGQTHQARQAALRTGRWGDAFAAVQGELRLARVPEHRHAAHWLAAELAACKLEQPAEAVAHLSRLTDLAPDDVAAQDCLIQVLVAAGQWAELVRTVETWIVRQANGDRRLAWHRLVFRVAREQLGDLPRAERHVRAALELCPHDGGALWALADLCEQHGRWPEAAEALATAAELERSRGGRVALLVRLGQLTLHRLSDPQRAAAAFGTAVQLDPTHREALRGLTECARQDGALERVVELSAPLIETEVDLRQRLRDLWALARELEPKDAARAGTLLARAVELAPADLEALGELVAFGGRWPQLLDAKLFLDRALRRMRERLAVDPEESFALHAIFRICHWRGLADGCWCAAQALNALGQADRDEQAFLARHAAPDSAALSRAVFEEEAQAWLLPAGLPPAVLRLFGALRQPITRLLGARLSEHGLSPRDRLTDSHHPWRVAADRLAREWGLETFEIYAVGHRPYLLTIEPCDPPAVLVGAAWLREASAVERDFVLARALWSLRQALTPAARLSGVDLRRLLVALLHLHGVDGSALGPVDGEVQAWSARLGRWVPRPVREGLLAHALECAGSGVDPLALPALAASAANRVGLLHCQSLAAALRVLQRAEDPTAATATAGEAFHGPTEARAELLRFAVADAYLLLRRRLGLAVAQA